MDHLDQADMFVKPLSRFIHHNFVNPMIVELFAENGGAAVNLVAIQFNLVHPDGDVYDYVYTGNDASLGGFVDDEPVPAGHVFKIQCATATLCITGDATQKGYDVDFAVRDFEDGPIVATHILRDIGNAPQIDVAQFQ
jgi:hypothetical protein